MRALRPEQLPDVLGQAGFGVAVVDAQGRYLYCNEQLAAVHGVSPEGHLGKTVAEILPEMAETVMPLIESVARTGRPLLAVTVAGSTAVARWRQWEANYLAYDLAGEPGVAIVVSDATERLAAAAVADRRLAQQTALADLGRSALVTQDLDEILKAGVDMLVEELRAERAGVLEFAPGRDHLWMRAGTGFPEAVGRMRAEAGPLSQAGFTIARDGPVVSRDTRNERRFRFTPALLELGVCSAISVPVPGETEPLGVLGVLSDEVDHFDDDDAALVRGVANILGMAAVRDAQSGSLHELAAQRGRLVAQALDAGEHERRQVADVLHDEVLQQLLFARLELEAVDGEQGARSRVQQSLEDAARVLRGVVAGLHPVTLAHAGLKAALESLVSETSQRGGLRVELAVQPEAEGHRDRLVISLARELLANVVRHAGATTATIDLRCVDGELRLQVADNGVGFDADAVGAAVAEGRVGLANARERVAALGGSTEIDGASGGRVAFRVPLS